MNVPHITIRITKTITQTCITNADLFLNKTQRGNLEIGGGEKQEWRGVIHFGAHKVTV
jgi:hypothetical protein